MKGFIFSLATTTAALILGCQNPDMNNPVATGDAAHLRTIAKASPTPAPRALAFDQKITGTNPGISSDVSEATGNLVFQITRVSPIDNGQYDVQITVNGEISTISSNRPAPRTAPWTFGGSSKDRIRILQGEKVVLLKTFVVTGPSVRTILNMPVMVSEQELEVGSMSLAKADQSSSNIR